MIYKKIEIIIKNYLCYIVEFVDKLCVILFAAFAVLFTINSVSLLAAFAVRVTTDSLKFPTTAVDLLAIDSPIDLVELVIFPFGLFTVVCASIEEKLKTIVIATTLYKTKRR